MDFSVLAASAIDFQQMALILQGPQWKQDFINRKKMNISRDVRIGFVPQEPLLNLPEAPWPRVVEHV